MRAKANKWWYVGAVFLAVGLLLCSFHRDIFLFSVKSYMNFLFPCKGGWEFSYGEAEWREGKVVLSDVSLATVSGSCEMQVPRIDLGLRHYKPKMFISTPSVILDQRKGKESFSLLSLVEGFLSKWKVDIDAGKGVLVQEDEGRIGLYFSWRSPERSGTLGHLALSSHADPMEMSDLNVEFYDCPGEVVLETQFVESDLAWLYGLAEFFGEPSVFFPKVTRGKIGGRLWASFYDNGVISQMNGSIVLQEASAINSDKHIETSLANMELEISYPAGKRSVGLREKFSLRNCVIKSRLQGGFIHYKDPQQKNEYALCDLCGPVNFNSFQDSEIDLKGYLDQKGQLSPILLRGRPGLLDANTLDIDFKVFLDEHQENITKLGVAITAVDEYVYTVKVAIEDLSKEQIGVIQHVIGLGFEPINDFYIAEGSISVAVGAHIERGHVCRLFIDKLIADSLQVYWKSADILGFCSQCMLKAEFDMQEVNPLAVPDIMLSVVHGDIIIGQGGRESISVSDLDLDISVYKGKLFPSRLTANMLGAWTELVMSGPYNDADLALSCYMTPEWIMSNFAGEPLETSLEEVVATLQLHRQKGCWKVLGSSQFRHKDGGEEELEFGYLLSDAVFGLEEKDFTTLYQTAISEGWLGGESLSGKTWNFFANCFGLDVKTTGALALAGTFDREGIYLKIDETSSKFMVPNAEFSLGEGSQFYYDLGAKSWRGHALIEHGSFEDQQSGLKFTEAQGYLNFQDNIFDIDRFSLDVEGVLVGGKGRACLNEEGVKSILVHADRFEGSGLQLQKLLSYVNPEYKLPFDGKIEALSEGIVFSAAKEGANWSFDWDIACRLSHGSLHVNHWSLEDFGFDFFCNSKEKMIHLFDIRGRWQDMYLLYGKEAHVSAEEIFCDLRLQNDFMDLARFVIEGKCQQEWDIRIDDEKSHFCGEKLSGGRFTFSLAKGLSSLHVVTELSLKEWLGKIHTIYQIPFLEKVPVEGRLTLALSKEEGNIQLSVSGEHINIHNHHFDTVHIDLEKEGSLWKLQRASLDDLFFQTQLIEYQDKMEIKDLFLFYKDTKLFAQGGNFSFSDQTITLPISSMDINLKQMQESLSLPLELEGMCKVGGIIYYKDFAIGGKISLASENLINTVEPLEFSYQMDEGLTVHSGSFVAFGEGGCLFNCHNARIKNATDMRAEGIAVTASNEAIAHILKGFSPLMQKEFPYSWKGSTECLFSFFREGDDYVIIGTCPEDYYLIADHYHHLEEVSFRLTPKELYVSVKAPVFDESLIITSHTVMGESYLTDVKAAIKGGSAECVISLQDQEEVHIHRLEGQILGLDFSFLPKREVRDAFIGHLKIQGDVLASYLPEPLAAHFKQFKIGKGYELGGEFVFCREQPEESFFSGFFKGKNFQILGAEWTTMLANIRLEKGKISIENLNVSDDALSVHVPLATSQGSQIHIPEIVVQSFRPSLMKSHRHFSPKLKPFCVNQVLIQDLSGDLENLQTITGKGSLTFENTFKRDHHILDVPIELISRIGLDPVLLIPINGEMDFTIKNKKATFTKLRNSYSEGKRSYFYLSSKKDSFIDFSGNIQMQIKMKQYVLFKITELFVLTVRGTLDDPRFSLK